MRKLFLLLPALVLSLFANAKEIEISSSTSNIIHSTIAASTTSNGDVIVLTDAGPYVNSKANSDDYTKIAKNVTIKAADGIQPVIKFEVPIQARDGKSGKFIGIKFDGSSLQYDQFIFVKDDDLNDNELEFEDCEFYNFSKYIVNVRNNTKANSLVFKNCKFYNNSTNRGILNQGNIGRLELDGCEVSNFVKEFIHGYSGTSHVDECVVNDCYFHDNSRSSIMFVASTVDGTQTCDQLTVTNSTFANIDASGEYESIIDIRPYGTAATDAIHVLVDHCTFYNNTVKNSDHANIRTAYLSDVTVSNCIFYYPSEYATRATYCTGGGNINNCLTYNYTAEGTKGHAYGATVNAASIVADPLFDNLANNKYTFAGDWTTTPMSLSPARGAATDGSDLGDPRWYTEVVYPSTDFATPYAFTADDAVLEGVGTQFLLEESVTPHYIRYADKADPGTATWYFTATRECYVQVTLNLADNSGFYSGNKHILEVQLYEGNNLLGSVAEGPAWEGDGFTENGVDKALSGSLHIPAAGNYSVKLLNNRHNSKTGIYGITLSYIGGAVQAMPGTTNIADAWFSAQGTRADGRIDFPDGYIQDGWAKWNVAFAESGSYKATVKVNTNSGHDYTVKLYRDKNDENPITFANGLQYSQKGSPIDLEINAQVIEAGSYIMEVVNSLTNSDAELISVEFIYSGGATVNIPNAAIPLNEAILNNGATRDNEGIHFGMADRYAEWNVVAAAGLYTFTFNISNPSTTDYGKYQLTIIDSESNTIYDEFKDLTASGSVTHSSIYLDGNYTLKVANTNNHSQGYITSIAATAEENVFIMDENTTDDGSIAAAAGNTYKFLLKRSFTAGKYYTICIPVSSWNDELKLAFGADYELWKMSSATQSGDEISLNFEQCNTESFHAGWPYLIKPSIDVQNPVFYNLKTIQNSTYNNVQSFDAADFVGSFYKTEIPAGESNLYLQNNNLYYSPTNATPMKGTRAWIRLKQQSGQQAPARARIVLQDKVATGIDLVQPVDNKAVKTIENGQLVIIKNGIRYNAMGTMIK